VIEREERGLEKCKAEKARLVLAGVAELIRPRQPTQPGACNPHH